MLSLPTKMKILFLLRECVKKLKEGFEMTVTTLLIVLLIVALVAGVPAWPHSRGWGYGPSGLIGIILVVLLVLVLLGRI